MKRTFASLLGALLLCSAPIALAACGQDDDGSVEEAVEEMKDEAEDARDEIEDEIDDRM